MEQTEFDPSASGWRNTGIIQEVDEARQKMAEERDSADYVYHAKSETHYWIVLVQHKATSAILDSLDGATGVRPTLDAETINRAPMVLCYICETPYEPMLRKRKCPGEPHE